MPAPLEQRMCHYGIHTQARAGIRHQLNSHEGHLPSKDSQSCTNHLSVRRIDSLAQLSTDR